MLSEDVVYHRMVGFVANNELEDVEADGFSFIPVTTTALVSRARGRLQHTSFIIVCPQAWTWDLPNTDKQREVFKRACWSLQGTKALFLYFMTRSNYTPSRIGTIMILNSKEYRDNQEISRLLSALKTHHRVHHRVRNSQPLASVQTITTSNETSKYGVSQRRWMEIIFTCQGNITLSQPAHTSNTTDDRNKS
jgi:hypothetical protein